MSILFFFALTMDHAEIDENLFGDDDEAGGDVVDREDSDEDNSVDHDPFEDDDDDEENDGEAEGGNESSDDISVAEDEQIETFVNMNEDEMMDHTNFIIAHEHIAALKFTIGQQAAFRLACMKIKDVNSRLNEVFLMMKSMKINEIYTM